MTFSVKPKQGDQALVAVDDMVLLKIIEVEDGNALVEVVQSPAASALTPGNFVLWATGDMAWSSRPLGR